MHVCTAVGRGKEAVKYVGIYWTLFAPMMKRSIKRRFGGSLAEQAIRQGKAEYRRLLSRADGLGLPWR